MSLPLFFGGCGHYYLPATHLETPEVRGQGWGRLETAVLGMASDLNAFAQIPSPDPETGEQGKPQVQKGFPSYSFGFSLPVGPKMEAGFRAGPYSPPNVKFKYQWKGPSETDSKKGDWSAAGVASGGVLLGQSSSAGVNVSYFDFDLAVPVGYRAWDRHLFSLTPFFSLAGLSGMALQAAYSGPVRAAQISTSTSMNQYGMAFGYQYNVLALFFRSEVTYLKGSVGQSELGGIYFGVLTGLGL